MTHVELVVWPPWEGIGPIGSGAQYEVAEDGEEFWSAMFKHADGTTTFGHVSIAKTPGQLPAVVRHDGGIYFLMEWAPASPRPVCLSYLETVIVEAIP